MINNQFSRRNLPTETRLALAYKFKEFETEKAKERQGTRNYCAKSWGEQNNTTLSRGEDTEEQKLF